MEVKPYKLIDIFENYDYLRKPLSSMERESFQGDYPYYGAQGVIDHVQDYICDGEYMLIAEDGENLMSRNQPIAVIVDGKFWVNNHAHIVKTNNLASMKYICYLLNSSDITGFITGSAQPKLSQANLNKIKMLLPSIEYQEQVASILSAYDNLIEVNNKRIKVLEQMAENLYKEWFVRFRFPGHESVPFENGLPTSWRKARITDFVSFLNGFAFKSEDYDDAGRYIVATIKNVQDGYFDLSNVERIDFLPTRMPQYCMLKKGDVIMSLTGNVGRVCIVSSDGCLLNQRVCKIESKYPLFAYLFFRQEAVFQTLCNIAYGTAQLNLSPILTGRMRTVLPPEHLMACFDEKVSALYEQIQSYREQSEILIKQRDLLLPRLMSGKLEV